MVLIKCSCNGLYIYRMRKGFYTQTHAQCTQTPPYARIWTAPFLEGASLKWLCCRWRWSYTALQVKMGKMRTSKVRESSRSPRRKSARSPESSSSQIHSSKRWQLIAIFFWQLGTIFAMFCFRRPQEGSLMSRRIQDNSLRGFRSPSSSLKGDLNTEQPFRWQPSRFL